MIVRVGDRLGCPACGTEVIVIRASAEDLEITCGGEPLAAGAEPGATPAPASHDGEGALIGKRYADPASGLELLCTKGGSGALAVGGAPLAVKAAKSLPSSD